MPRLPQPGGDNGNWGVILNDFLAQALKPDGAIKDNAVTTSAIAPNAVDATIIKDGSITETNLDASLQIKVNAVAGTPDWNTITNKPAVIAAGVDATAAKAALALVKSDVGLGNVDNTSDATKNSATVTLTNKTISGASNTLSNIPESAVTNLTSDLAGKAPTVHTHTAVQISDSTATGRSVLTAADAAAARSAIGAGSSNLVIGTTSTTAKAGDYAPTKSEVGLGNVDNTSDLNKPISTAQQTALNAKADLVGGLVPTAQIPSLAYTTSVTVANQVAMLALTSVQVQPGDLAIRTDGAGTFILTGADPSVLSNWTLLDSPTAPVTSVNSQTGTVVLGGADVGLGNVNNTSDINKPISSATQTALNAKADLVGGVVPSNQLPAISLNTAVTVANQSAMLALSTAQVQPGDLAIRTDGAGTFILTATDPSILGNWTLLNSPTAPVTSVNSQTGAVTLSKTDVGLGNVDNTSDATKNSAAVTLTNKTLTNPKVNNLLDTNGNSVLYLAPITSAVNYVQVNNQSTGNAPALTAVGSDTNISLNLASKGTGVVKANGNQVLTQNMTLDYNTTLGGARLDWFYDIYGYPLITAVPVATPSNLINIGNAVSGSDPFIQGDGIDTNVGLNLTTKGSGKIKANGIEVATISGTQTLTNKTISGANNTITNISASSITDYPEKVVSPSGDASGATDATAINAAIGSGDVVVRLRPGIYYINTSIILKSHTRLVGSGMLTTTIRLANGVNASMIKNYVSPNGILANAEFVSVKDLSLEGNKANQTSGHGIEFNMNPVYAAATNDEDFDSHQLVENVRIYKCKQDGFNGNGRSETRLINLYVYGCDGNGIVPSFDSFLVSCTAAWSGLAGFRFVQSSIVAVGCKSFYSGQITAASGHGFYLTGGTYGMNLSSCVSQDNKATGYLIDSISNVTMASCSADSNSTSGVGSYPGLDMWAATNSTIIGFLSLERKTDGTNSYQQNALRMRSSSVANKIDLTHSAVNGASVGIAIMATSTTTGNTITVNGTTVESQVLDTGFTLQDDGDTTKQLKFQLSGITTATTRTLTVPDANTTIVGTDATQTLTNKTLTSPKVNAILDTTNSVNSFVFSAASGAVNYLQSNANTAGNNPQLFASGSDTNISLELMPKGTGTARIWVTTGKTPTVEAAGADTNHNLNLISKGTGVVQANSNPVVSSVTGIPAVTGTPSSSNYLRGDGTWSTPAGGGGGMLAPVQGMTVGSETFTISAGSVTQISGTTINGYTPAIGDRILVANAPATTGVGSSFAMTSQPANGVYVVTSNTTNLSVSRSSDMSGSVKPGGLSIYVENATWPGSKTIFYVTSPNDLSSFTWGTNNVQLTWSGGPSGQTQQIWIGNSTNSFNIWNGTGWATVNPAASAGNQNLTLPATATDTIVARTSTDTLTNKRVTKRSGTASAPGATPTLNTDNYDAYTFTSIGANITSMTTNLSGTPVTGDEITLGFKDDGTPRTITWGASFQSSGVATLLATTAAGKQHWMKLMYDGSKWTCMAVDGVGY